MKAVLKSPLFKMIFSHVRAETRGSLRINFSSFRSKTMAFTSKIKFENYPCCSSK